MFWAARALHWRSQRACPSPVGAGNLVKLRRAGDRSLQFLILNEEFLVSASQQLALITSLPFVHTARRYYRLNGLVRSSDWNRRGRQRPGGFREVDQTWSFRGSKSRNKVSVGEPAEGSLPWRSLLSIPCALEHPRRPKSWHRCFLPSPSTCVLWALSVLLGRGSSGPCCFARGWRLMLGPPDSFCNAKLSFPSPRSFFSLQNSFNFVLLVNIREISTTSNGGPLGSCIDEERSKLRYVVWIAEFSESSSLWTQMALPVKPGARLSERPFHWSVSHVFALVWGVVVCLYKSLASLEVMHCPSQTAKCRRVACTLTSVRDSCQEPTFVQLDLRSGETTCWT